MCWYVLYQYPGGPPTVRYDHYRIIHDARVWLLILTGAIIWCVWDDCPDDVPVVLGRDGGVRVEVEGEDVEICREARSPLQGSGLLMREPKRTKAMLLQRKEEFLLATPEAVDVFWTSRRRSFVFKFRELLLWTAFGDAPDDVKASARRLYRDGRFQEIRRVAYSRLQEMKQTNRRGDVVDVMAKHESELGIPVEHQLTIWDLVDIDATAERAVSLPELRDPGEFRMFHVEEPPAPTTRRRSRRGHITTPPPVADVRVGFDFEDGIDDVIHEAVFGDLGPRARPLHSRQSPSPTCVWH